jgi:dTDP-4-amino-4,6-dideoxygalactose transaminase
MATIPDIRSNGYRVPRSQVDESHRQLRTEILQALEPLLFEHPGHLGDARHRLEAEFAALMGRRHALAVHSGTVGLFVALKACGAGPGDEVITVGNSDVSTTAAISHCGAIPVLCDVLETDFTIDPDLVAPLITERTVALLPVDLHGHPADVRRLRDIAAAHHLKIVEDAALATGAYDYGVPVGAFADVALFSFAPFKPLGCLGNGAMLVTDDDELADRLALLIGYGHGPHDPDGIPGYQRYVAEGYNVPLDPLQAALVSVKLPHLPAWTARRRAIAHAYHEGLADLPVTRPSFRPESGPTFRSYTICVADQQGVYQSLLRSGIEAVLHYAPPIYRQPLYEWGLSGADSLPVTERLAQQLVNLPVTVELTDRQVDYVIEVLSACLR